MAANGLLAIASFPTRATITGIGTLPLRKPGTLIDSAISEAACSSAWLTASSGTSISRRTLLSGSSSTVVFTDCPFNQMGAEPPIGSAVELPGWILAPYWCGVGVATEAPAMAKREITVREREVLMLVSAGVSSREIAARLAISPATVGVARPLGDVQGRRPLAGPRSAPARRCGGSSEVAAGLEAEHRGLLELLATGLTREHAAQALFLSRRSVDRRLAALRRRVGVASTAELLLAVLSPPDTSPADVSR